jgi:hypothetical protein
MKALSAGATDVKTLVNWLMEHPVEVNHVAAAGAPRNGEPQKPVDVTVIEDDTPKDKEEATRLSFPVSHSVTSLSPPPLLSESMPLFRCSPNLICNSISLLPCGDYD